MLLGKNMNLSNATEKHFKETNPHIKEWPYMSILGVSDPISFIVNFESFGDPEKDAPIL